MLCYITNLLSMYKCRVNHEKAKVSHAKEKEKVSGA